ncbi:MAG: hypothetical protein GY769_21690 [bacterium]|nr:hypothetical protein [bacterium]
MTWINSALRAVFDAALAPFSGLPEMAGLTLVSLICAIGMLWVFKRTSNQNALAAVKSRIHAGLFEIRLFNDNLPAIFRAQTQILKANAKYLWHSLPPLLWIIVPFVFIVAQLQFHYGYRGLQPGDSVLLTVRLSEDADALTVEGKPRAALELPAGLEAEAGPVWAPALREMSWRIGAREPGDYSPVITFEGDRLEKSVRVVDEITRLSPHRVAKGFVAELVYPAEAPFDSEQGIESVEISYPDREVNFFGWRTHWMVAFFILTIVFAFLLRKPMGVTI